MKVGFITSTLKNGSAGRGIGVYTSQLLKNVVRYQDDFSVQIEETSEKYINDSRYDLIHYPYFDLFFHTLPVFHRPKVVVTCHDVVPLEFPQNYPPGIRGSFNNLLQRIALRNVSAVITDSYASVRGIRNELMVPHEKIKLIYLGPVGELAKVTNQKKLQEVKHKYQLPAKFILNVGDINWNKNIPGLIDACEVLGVTLVIVGRTALAVDSLDASHPELAHIRYLQEKFSTNHILRLGFIPDEDFAAVCSLATVYCQPSFAEGFGLSVLHALRCQTPVACSNTHSLPEIAGEGAVYFDPHSQSDMISAIKSLLTDNRLRQKVIRAGVTQAEKFSWEKAAKETLGVYKQIEIGQT